LYVCRVCNNSYTPKLLLGTALDSPVNADDIYVEDGAKVECSNNLFTIFDIRNYRI